MRRSTDPRLLAAALLLTVAALVFGATLARALTTPTAAPGQWRDDPGASSVEQPDSGDADGRDTPLPRHAGAREEPLPMEALLLAVDHDPFRADRQRAPERYRLPGEEPPPPPAEPPPPPPIPAFRLVGTAVTPTGGMAVLQLENAPPRMLAIGEAMLGYRLADVSDDGALLESPDGRTVSLLLSRALVASTPPPGRGQQRGGTPAEAAARERLEAVNRAVQQQGGSPQAQEALRRLLESLGGTINGGNTTYEFAPSSITIRRPGVDTIPPPPPPPNRNN